MLFGPAYKGIPLSVATTIAFSELYGKEIRYCSNRKEVKDHGDTGILLGSKIKDGDKVVIIEDVTTSGKSIEETFPIIKAQGDVEIIGLMVSLNRMERGLTSNAAHWMRFSRNMALVQMRSLQWRTLWNVFTTKSARAEY